MDARLRGHDKLGFRGHDKKERRFPLREIAQALGPSAFMLAAFALAACVDQHVFAKVGSVPDGGSIYRDHRHVVVLTESSGGALNVLCK
jgi:hypothetical protein